MIDSKEYTLDYYRKMSLAVQRGEFVLSGRLEDAVSLLRSRGSQKLLDIGSGCGEIVIKGARCGIQCIGIDYSQAGVHFGMEILEREPAEVKMRARFLRMDATHLGFKDSSFDAVALIDVIEHLDDDDAQLVLKEIERVLKRDGRIVIHTDNRLYIRYGRPCLQFILSLCGS